MEKHIVDRTFEQKYKTVIYWLAKPAPKRKFKTLSVIGKNKHGIRKEVLR